MRLSSIDIGSNAIRQIIVAVDDHNQWEVLKKERFPIRLGNDVFNSKKIQEPTLALMVNAFKEFARNNKNFRVEKTMVVVVTLQEAKIRLEDNRVKVFRFFTDLFTDLEHCPPKPLRPHHFHSVTVRRCGRDSHNADKRWRWDSPFHRLFHIRT